MMRATGLAIAAAIATAAAMPSHGQLVPKRKPGVWEVQTGSTGAEAPNLAEKMAKMSPEQRAQMEEFLKRQNMAIGGSVPNSFSMRYCLAPQEASQEASDTGLPNFERNASCQRRVTQRSATEIRFTFACTNKDGTRTEGEGRYYDFSPEHYAAEMSLRTSGNRPRKMLQKGRWLGSDCSALK